MVFSGFINGLEEGCSVFWCLLIEVYCLFDLFFFWVGGLLLLDGVVIYSVVRWC